MFISLPRLWAALSLLTLASAASAASAPRDAPPLTVPLRRRTPSIHKRGTPQSFAAMADHLRAKYGRPTLSNLRRRQGTGSVSITDENSDSSYSAQLSIGTPGQNFGVILDTGSSDLWLASTQCTQGCSGGVAEYNSGSSSSFTDQNQPISITYGSGAIQGDLASDTVSLGGFTATQTFVTATGVSSGLLDSTLSGLLGLGFKSIANTGATPLVQGLASGSSFTQPLMSFYLERHIDDSNAGTTAPGGTFTLGGTNSSLFTGNIDYVNIPSTVTPGFWLLPVTGVTVQGNTASTSSSSSTSNLAAIDTGTTLIGGPSAAVAAVYAQIPGAQNGTGELTGYYTYPCNTAVDVTFSFGGVNSWPINSADFQLQAQGSGGAVVCIGAIFDLDASSAPQSPGPGGSPPRRRQSADPSTDPSWIVGDTFLKNVYSVFRYDPPSVGFAQLNPSLPGAGETPGAAVNTGGPSATETAATSALANPSSHSASNGNGSGNGAADLHLRTCGAALAVGLAGAVVAVLRIV